MSWLRIIRWKNLLIIFLTQFLTWFCVIAPNCSQSTGYRLDLNNFFFLSLSTVLIAAAGYIINDYFDIKIDVINKPGKVVLERAISLKTAIVSHTALNVFGIFLAAIVAFKAHHPEWLLIQLACTILLWFYSTHFKRQFVVGNFVVALLSAFTIIVLLIYEPAMFSYFSMPLFWMVGKEQTIINPVWLLCIYTFFAFILSWMREVVKDMEDYKGDAEEGCVTMPIKWGLQRSGRFTQVLGWTSVLVLFACTVGLLIIKEFLFTSYVLIALIAPLMFWILTINKKATKEHYHKASRNLKIIMVLGIGSLIVNYFLEWLG
jgi:4-hydroxybenzoate polyprenyltransferase